MSDNSVRIVINAPHEFHEVLYNEPLFVCEDGITRLHAASIQLGVEYQKLREFAWVADRRDWHIAGRWFVGLAAWASRVSSILPDIAVALPTLVRISRRNRPAVFFPISIVIRQAVALAEGESEANRSLHPLRQTLVTVHAWGFEGCTSCVKRTPGEECRLPTLHRAQSIGRLFVNVGQHERDCSWRSKS